MWIDDDGGSRCGSGKSVAATFTAHTAPARYVILAKVWDAMDGADVALGSPSTVDLMSAIAKTFQLELNELDAQEVGFTSKRVPPRVD
jgi:hypothetical protein